MKRLTVADVMSRDPISLSASDPVSRVGEELELSRIRHLPIVDRRGVLVGLITSRDLLELGDDGDAAVSEVMWTDIHTVSPETTAHEAAYILLRYDVGCAPVVDGEGKLVGIVTDTDFVRIAYTALGGTVSVDQLEAEEHEADNL